MKPHFVSLVHALVLIAMSAWGYFGSATPSPTALIPAAFGVLLLLCNPGLRKESKAIAHVAVGLTALLVLALPMPLMGALGRGDMLAALRVGTMLGVTLLALASFIQSFRSARKARELPAPAE